jgi:hypothetical protein
MFCCVRRVEGFTVQSVEGSIGKVQDLLFDDLSWIIRYLIVDTHAQLARDRALLLMLSVAHIDWENEIVPVNLTKESVNNSPEVGTPLPVSRQKESQVYNYYGRTPYWGAGFSLGAQAIADMVNAQDSGLLDKLTSDIVDSHLRSTRKITGYRLTGANETIGKIVDYLVESNNWIIRYLVIETSDQKHHLISPQWIHEINWPDEMMAVNLDEDLVRSAPQYEYGNFVTREYEEGLYQHYHQKAYWE